MVQSSETGTLGLRMVRTELLFPCRSQSGPSSISALRFEGSIRAFFGPEERPRIIILSTMHGDENRVLPGALGTKLEDVSLPFENTNRRWMKAPFVNSKLFPSSI